MLHDRSVDVKFETLKGKTIALCVTGSIAAVETVKLCRELRRYSADVMVYMTQGAQQFITPLSLEWASGHKVVTDLSGEANHIVSADLVLVAPASLNTINKAALGLADNVVTATVASAWGQGIPIVFVSAMHESLARNPVLEKNINFLKEQKNILFLNGKHEEGKEKITDSETIASWVSHLVSTSRLRGKKVLITAGPTHAPIDPIRHIGNFSTGELGVMLAHELYLHGADPTVVYGPGRVTPHSFYPVLPVTTPDQMLEAVLSQVQYQKYDAAIFAAAVLDHVSSKCVDEKISSGEDLAVDFVKTPKIINEVDKAVRASCENVTKRLFKVGFKLGWKKSKEELIQMGESALETMNAHVVIANDLSKISDSRHPAIILDRVGAPIEIHSKKEIVHAILAKLTNAL